MEELEATLEFVPRMCPYQVHIRRNGRIISFLRNTKTRLSYNADYQRHALKQKKLADFITIFSNLTKHVLIHSHIRMKAVVENMYMKYIAPNGVYFEGTPTRRELLLSNTVTTENPKLRRGVLVTTCQPRCRDCMQLCRFSGLA